MRVFSKGRLARAIAHLLALTFIGSTWLTGVVVSPAAAQIATRAATTQSVAVAPFDNLSGILPEVLGDEAAAAISVELRDRLLPDVLPKADVTLQMRDLGYTPPLSDMELVRLAAELEVALVVTGQVRAARILRSPEGRFAEVVLAVRLFDRVARADVNGALVTGKGPASPDASDEVLLRKALAQAAFDAVEEMKSRPTITAMVLWSRGEKMFFNVGTAGGVVTGMKLVGVRSGERIGVVRVTEADATGAYADLVEGTSLRTGDHLRAIYELPTTVGAAPARVIAQTGKRFENVLIAAALLFGLAGHAARARLITEGGIAAPRFCTSNLANAAEMAYGGWFYSITMPGYLIPLAATLSTWEPYQGTQESRVLVYEIWRNDRLAGHFPVHWLGESKWIDGVHSPVWEYVTYSIDPLTGELASVDPEADWFIPDYDDETGEFLWDDWDSFVDGHDDQIGKFLEDTDLSYGMIWGPDYEGPAAGQYYVYRLKPMVAKQIQVADGTYEWVWEEESEYSSEGNIVIPVTPPGAYDVYWVFQGYDQGVYEIWDVFANPEIAANIATFHFYSSVGADEAIVQVTRDPNVTFDPQGVLSQSTPISYGYEATVQVDLTKVPGTGDIYWWRVGAHNRRSTTPPRPWPLHLANDYGWVWSRRLTFASSPLSRASLLHQQREAVARSEMRGVRL
ncbi:MAG: hypothetical protein JSV79_08800, partial [Armatimonadota bacterium]